ncbi:MAG TPA: NAD(P)/FAD-dependent oxidoreductase [Planctomycetota bacterium]|nr:NAD(P)/FAD-dependent oxidoreductase [Planctomycetota bacterium]
MRRCDVLVIGGGAAGLYCAITAGRRGRSVVVVDHADKLGRKILISGGGRCNFTNRDAGPANYLSANPHFCKSALARFSPEDFIALVERHGIAYHEKKLGQLFCDGPAKQIVDLLLAECAAANVAIVTGCRVASVDRDERFTIVTDRDTFSAERVVVATGGLSIPTIGATDFGYALARRFGLKIVATDPALVPFTLGAADGMADLSGVSADAVVRTAAAEFREHLLVTHAGLSGPAILQVSSYWRHGAPVTIDLAPERDLAAMLADAKRAGVKALASNHLGEFLPKRLAQRRLAALGVDKPVAQLGARDIAAIADALHAWRVVPSGTEGYRKAEVTRGGVDTAELSSQTMEARTVPGLHFIGEVVDVTGWLGGYNFQWAWASGNAAGLAV